MFNFDFLGEGLEIVFPSHFVYDLSKKKEKKRKVAHVMFY